MNDRATSSPGALKRFVHRLVRFRLSTLLVLTLAVAVWLAFKLYREPMTGANLEHVQSLAKIETNAWEIQWSPNRSKLALIGWEQPVDIRESVTLLPLKTACQGKKVIHFAFSKDPGVTAYCENGTVVEIADANADRTIRIDAKNAQPRMEFSPNGRLLATGGYGNSAYLWNTSDGALVQTLQMGPNTGGLTVAFSPDGRTLAVGNRNHTARLFDVASGRLLHELRKMSSHGLAFHPSGKRLAIAYVEGSICLWDVSSGKRIVQRQTDADEIYRVNWSPRGDLLVSCGLNTEIVIWDGADLTKLHVLDAPEWVIGASFSPDGARLITAGGDRLQSGRREVEVWGIPLLGRLIGH